MGGGMCAATCSAWWLVCCGPNPEAWSFTKHPSWRVATSPEALAAQVPLWCVPQEKKKKMTDPVTFKQKQTVSCALMVAMVFFPSFLLLSAFFRGQPPLTKLQSKQSSVNTGWNKGKHGLLWRVWWVSDHVWWTFLILSLWCYFFSCWVRCFEKPGPPPRAHLLSRDNQTNGFHRCSHWPLTPQALSCPVERSCFRSLSGSITSFPPEQLKRLAV